MEQATAEVHNLIAYNDGLNTYDDTMRNALKEVDTFLSEPELVETHDRAKNESIARVSTKILSLSHFVDIFIGFSNFK